MKNLKIKENKYNILEQNNKKIRYIIHISDIHIRKNTRKEEYEYVFNNLFNKLRELKIDSNNSVIIITGDIIHDKSELSAQSVYLLKEFYIGLSSITTTISIIGNHDRNINTENNELDSISPVIGKAFKTDNPVYILLDDELYEYNNIMIGVTTIYANKITECNKIRYKKEGKICIGLYHGIVEGSKTDIGYNFTNTRLFNQKDFKKNYDYILLGDIHKHQYLDKEKRIWYAGSLIQQTRDESITEHGFELLDIDKNSKEFYRIKNKYGMIEIKVDKDGETDFDNTIEYPENLDVKIISNYSDNKCIDNIYETIKNKNITIIDKSHVIDYSNYGIDMKINVNGQQKNVINLNTKTDIMNVIIDYIKEKNKLTNDIIKNITDKVENILNKINYERINRCRKIRLETLEFNNMLIYGKDNKIDFRLFKNTVGLSDKIDAGKSSIIDIILVAIFGECTRGNKFDILHNGETKYTSKIVLYVNDIKYTITRIGKYNGNKLDLDNRNVKENITIYENDKNITCDKTPQTNKLIREKVCEYEELLLTSIITQKNSISFINLNDKDKRDILCKITHLDIFDKIYNEAHTEVRGIAQIGGKIEKEYNEIRDDKIIEDIDKLKTIIDNNNNKVTELNNKREELRIELGKIEMNKENIEKKINNDIEIDGYIDIDTNEDKLIEKNKEELEKRENIYKIKNNELEKIKGILKGYININKDNDDFLYKKKRDINEKNNQLNNLYKEIINIEETKNELEIKENKNKIELKKNEDIIRQLEEEIRKDKDIEYIDEVEIENKYKLNKEKEKEKEKLEENKKKIEEDIDKNKKYEKDFINYKYNKNCKYCKENSLTKQKIYVEERIKELTEELEEIENKLNKIEINKEIEEEYRRIKNINIKNKEIENEIKTKKIQIENENIKKIIINKERDNIIDKLKQIEKNKEIEERIKIIKGEIKKIENKKNNKYEEYLSIIERKEIIEEEINNNNKEIIEIRTTIEKIEHIKKNKNEIKEQIKIREELELNNKRITKINIEINEIIREIKTIENINKTERDKLQIKENINNKVINLRNKIEEYNRDKEEYKIIINTLTNNGIIDNILTNKILPQLETIVNNIYENIGNYKIKIKYSKNIIYILKDNKLSLSMNGGGLSHIFNIIFRIALSQLNNYIKPNFMIIDEAFDNCDTEGKNSILKLIDIMRTYYEWILIISHDNSIKMTYDKQIIINTIDNKTKNIVY